MKSLRVPAIFLFFGLLAAAGAELPKDEVSLRAPDAPVSTLLQMYQAISKNKVMRSDEVRGIKTVVDVNIRKVPKTEALQSLEALLRQAGVQLVHFPNGLVVARLIPHPKENQPNQRATGQPP